MGQWVFGGVERESGKCFKIPVPNRTAEVLLKLIVEWILPGTIIMGGGQGWGFVTTIEL